MQHDCEKQQYGDWNEQHILLKSSLVCFLTATDNCRPQAGSFHGEIIWTLSKRWTPTTTGTIGESFIPTNNKKGLSTKMARHKKEIPINLGISRTTHLGQGKIYTALFFGLKTYFFKSPSVWHETITSGEIELNSARIMVKYNMYIYIYLFICIYIYVLYLAGLYRFYRCIRAFHLSGWFVLHQVLKFTANFAPFPLTKDHWSTRSQVVVTYPRKNEHL